MINNYTPLDLKKFKNDGNDKLNTLLLAVASFTALVFAVLLFILIQKKLNEPLNTTTKATEITEELIISPSPEPEPTTPEPTEILLTITPTASLSATPAASLIPSASSESAEVNISSQSPIITP